MYLWYVNNIIHFQTSAPINKEKSELLDSLHSCLRRGGDFRPRSAPELRLAHLSRVGVRSSPRASSDTRFVLRSSDLSPRSFPTCSNPSRLSNKYNKTPFQGVLLYSRGVGDAIRTFLINI